MEGYNYQIANEIYIDSLKRKLSEAIADMIANEEQKGEFIYVNFHKYDTVFMEVARIFNCDIEYIQEKYMCLEEVTSKRYTIRIKPSNKFNVVRTKKKIYLDDEW